MKIEIKSKLTGSVLFSFETESLKLAVEAAVKSGANLCDANLCDANLRGADLRGANLCGAVGLPTTPIIPNIDAKILAAIEAGCSLDMSNWHTCETTHCRAGWACVLAGYAGGILEGKTTPYLAGRLIYEASRPGVPCPDFFATNEEALKDLKEWAAKDPIK